MPSERDKRTHGPEAEAKPPVKASAEPTPGETLRARGAEMRQALRRATYLALGLAAAALTFRAIVGNRGLLAAHRSRVEVARLQADVAKWKERNEYLERRIQSLRDDPAAVEAIARERLGWARPGEVTFLFPHDPATPEPGDPGPVAPGEFSPTLGEEVVEPGGDGSAAPAKP